MKCKIKGRRLYFLHPSQKEINWLNKKLTFEGHPVKEKYLDENGVEAEKTVVPVENLLFTDADSQEIYTYYGLFGPLQRAASFPMELVDEVQSNFNRLEVDKNLFANAPEPIVLEDFQVAAVAKALMLKNGITQIPTGGGKTEVILAVLRILLNEGRLKKLLIIVPSVGLCTQFYQRALKRGFKPSEIGMVNGRTKQFDQPVVVAVVNSINIGLKENKQQVMDLLRAVDFLGYDEVHHLRADTWLKIATTTEHSDYLLGWSGSPFLDDDLFENSGDALLMGLMGRVIFTETYEHLQEIGLISTPVVFMKPVPGNYSKFMASFNYIYNRFIIENKLRNEYIQAYTREFCKYGFSVLILIQRKEHAFVLMEMISELDPICVFGGNKAFRYTVEGVQESYLDYDIFREQFANGQYKVVIASQVMDEGMDIPNIGAVILGGGGKSKIKLTQRLGRGLRRKKVGLNRVYVLDFYDKSHVFLASHSKKRAAFFEEARAIIVENPYQFMNMIYQHAAMLAQELSNETES